MIAPTTKITWRGSPETTMAELRRVVKPQLQKIGVVWHRRTLPKHFEDAALNRYKYQRRRKGYSITKARRKGHNRPLVWDGDLERQVTRIGRVSSTSKGVTVAMTGPRYLYAYRKDLQQPDKAAEMTATTPDERAKMDKLLDIAVTRDLNAVRTIQTVRSI